MANSTREREFALKKLFSRYLTEIAYIKGSTQKHYSPATVNHYFESLKYISKILVARGLIKESIYEVESVEELEKLNTILEQDPEYVKTNTDGHNMYSAGMKLYIKFASGEEFTGTPGIMGVMDTPVPRPRQVKGATTTWARNGIIKKFAMQSATYLCEIDAGHTTFIEKGTDHQYMEGHHIIPMGRQDQFKDTLDATANIVCLCPICHRLMHYGRPCDKKDPLNEIYAKRADRLAKCGIRLSRDEFDSFVL